MQIELTPSDLLRTIGRLLDAQKVHQAEVWFESELVRVQPVGDPSPRLPSAHWLPDLLILSVQARSGRGQGPLAWTDTLESLLRTLGQELGAMHFDLRRLHVTDEIR